jgi:hypothetical protein
MTDIGMQTTEFGHYGHSHPWGERPDDLPISAAVWDQAKTPGNEKSTFVVKALYEAVKQLEERVAEHSRDDRR